MRLIYVLLFLIWSPLSYSQVTTIHRNPEILRMANQVSSDSLKEYLYGLLAFGTRHSLSQDSGERGIEAARQYVLRKFRSFEPLAGGRLTSEIDYFTVGADGKRVAQKTRMGNVMATLKGSDPKDDRVFVVSGHIDSRVTDIMDHENDAPGANDDGSGVVALIEMVRIMSRKSFPATIVFVAVSGEEQGLIGATHLAKRAKEEQWNLVAMINNDMIGNSRSSGTEIRDNTKLRVFSEGVPLFETDKMATLRRQTNAENDSKSRQLARYIKEIGERYVDHLEIKLLYRNDRFLRGGDHTPFSREGFTAVRLCEMNENYNQQHQDIRMEEGIAYGDKPEHIDFEYLRKNTAVNLVVLTSLAKAPSVPREVGIVLSELTNSSRLTWIPPAFGEADGYYVLIRETSSAMWEKKIYTRDRSIEIPYSKDNYFFAVQAVSKEGEESLAVFPAPIR